jgi:hypothetical protein
VEASKDALNESRVGGIVNQRLRPRIDGDPNVGAKEGRSACSDPRRDVWVALLQPTDDRSSHSDRSRDGCLAETGTQTYVPESLAELDAGTAELAVSFEDCGAADRRRGHGVEARLSSAAVSADGGRSSQ